MEIQEPKISAIMACRNEEKNIKLTLDSLKVQTVKLNEIVIVDDASTDNTYEILQKFSNGNNCKIIRRDQNDERHVSIVNSLKLASSSLSKDFDYLMILDGDTILEPQYIEKIISKFQEDKKLGIAGGSLLRFHNKEKNYHFKNIKDDFVFGSNRIYSKKCWFDINDEKILNVNSVNWDPEHSTRALVRDYNVKRFDDVKSYSLRSPGKYSSYEQGFSYYQFGHSFPAMIIISIKKLNCNFLAGYLAAWFDKKEKIDNEKNMKIIKQQNDASDLEEVINRFYSKGS